MEIVETRNKREKVSIVRSLIKSAGTKIGSVHFIARGTGKLRKMSYRLKVSHPQYEKVPTGQKSRVKNYDRSLMTVFDVNCIRYNTRGKMNGRGGYKSIPLDSVVRIKVDGIIYKFV